MDQFIPKIVTEDEWKKLEPNKPYAVLCRPEDTIYLRLGAGKSFYIGVYPIKSEARLLNTIQYDSGEESLLYKLSRNSPILVGRTPECNVKILLPIISRQHLQMAFEDNILVLKDLGSVNGTYLHRGIWHFDIDDYLASHGLDEKRESTMDETHEIFGPTLDDFFRRYLNQKDKKNDAADNKPQDASTSGSN